jgi:hypothetical protein
VHPGRSTRSHLRTMAAPHDVKASRVSEVIEMTGWPGRLLSESAHRLVGGVLERSRPASRKSIGLRDTAIPCSRSVSGLRARLPGPGHLAGVGTGAVSRGQLGQGRQVRSQVSDLAGVAVDGGQVPVIVDGEQPAAVRRPHQVCPVRRLGVHMETLLTPGR